MFSKGCHVIGDNSLQRELQAERRRYMPIVPERPFNEIYNSTPRMAATRQTRRVWRFRRLSFR